MHLRPALPDLKGGWRLAHSTACLLVTARVPARLQLYNAKYRKDVYALAWTCFAVSFVSLPLALATKK